MVSQRLWGHNLKYNIDYNLDSNQGLNLRLGICLFVCLIWGFRPERPSCIPKKMFVQKSQLVEYSNLWPLNKNGFNLFPYFLQKLSSDKTKNEHNLRK